MVHITFCAEKSSAVNAQQSPGPLFTLGLMAVGLLKGLYFKTHTLKHIGVNKRGQSVIFLSCVCILQFLDFWRKSNNEAVEQKYNEP